MLRTAGLLAAFGLGGLLIPASAGQADSMLYLTLFCVRTQDLPVAAALIGLFALIGWRWSAGGRPLAIPRGGAGLAVLLTAMVLGLWLIRTRVLFDHDFTRDEHMASFDAAIFASGRLVWPIPPDLRPFYSAFNDLFVFPLADRAAWVSAYLPVNAAVRALLGQVLPAALVSPLEVALAAVALWRIALRLWPGETQVHAVVVLCLLGSSQVLLIGTGTFAMTLHLALNLVWLALFLRGTRAGHAGAIAVGLLATGIHQPLFHPLFVAPFLILLAERREWRTLGAYLAGYAAIAAVWLAWPHWIAAQVPHVGAMPPPGGLFDRLAEILAPPGLVSLWLMAGNLLRFITWQHALAVPLALVGLRAEFGRDPLVRALARGLLLTVAVLTVLIPPQGHGWGYRYLHGLIGNLCLLAGYGWQALAVRGAAPARAMRVATAVSLLVLLPLHTWMVRSFIAPYALAARAFARLDADYVVVDGLAVPFGGNYVANPPDLASRPRLLLSGVLDPEDLARLCPGRTIAFADADALAAVPQFYGAAPATGPSPGQQSLREAARGAGCTVIAAPVN